VQLIEAAIVSHFAQADQAVAGLEPAELAELARLLRKAPGAACALAEVILSPRWRMTDCGMAAFGRR
jgi:hypothetical protein